MMGKFLEISWRVRYEMNQKDELLASSPLSSSSGAKSTPAVVFITVILALLFLISGLLHLLVRFLTKRASPSQSNHPQNYASSDTLQRQLQQLFHLHDSGLDQSSIDSLPVFPFKEISGRKEAFDCAVCLCEFSESDDLRLLPMCSHAFHIHCIDTWLLSNSTCPLCRGAPLIPGFSYANPVFDYDEVGEEMEEDVAEKGVFSVRLGKLRRLNDAGGECSSSVLDARRCYSMGSYQYVVGDAKLRVALSHENRGSGSIADQACSSSSSSTILDGRRCFSMGSHHIVGVVG